MPEAAEPVPVSTPSAAAAGEAPAAPAPAAPPQLVQIDIVGLKEVAESRVRSMLQAREFEPYTPAMRAADMSVLLGSGLFTSVSMREVALSSSAYRLDVALVEGAPRAAAAPKTELDHAAEALGAAAPDSIPSPPWVLGEVGISGNENVKEGTIRKQVRARKGDLYTRSDLDQDIQNVLSLGSFERVAADITVLRDRRVPEHFESVSPSLHPIKLTFLIEEKPRVREIRFEGRKRLSKGRLLEEMSLKKKDPFDRVRLREDVESMEKAYRKKGFLKAAIEPGVSIDTETLHADLLFKIEEGPKSHIEAVRFAGVTAFKEKKLRKQMKNRPGRFFKRVFEREKLEEDLKKVEEYYKNRGYMDYELESSSVSFSDDGTEVFIDLAVKEGRQYRFGDTTFAGHTLYVSTDLAKAVEYRKGKLFDDRKFKLTVHEIQTLYAEKGRLHAQLQDSRRFNPETGLLDIHFDVYEGPPVYIDHVDVEGYKATKPWVFKRELLVKPGQLFQVSKVRKSQEKILNLGFIDDVQLDVQSPYDRERVDLAFEIFEGKPGMLTAGAGFSSLDGLLGTLSLQHLNLFGRAWRTKLQWSFGARVNDYSASWTTPWLGDSPTSLGFDVFNTRRISPFEGSSSGFVSKRTGGAVRLGPRFQDDKFQLFFRYSFQNISISSVEPQFRGQLAEGTSSQSTIGAEAAIDTRDNIWDPARGGRHSLGASVSGGPLQGNIHLFKPSLSNSQHWTLAHIGDYPLVFTIANRAAYVTQFGESKEVPVFERYFIGGQDTLRGYSASGEAGYRQGAKVFDVFNVELGFPLARERKRTIVKFVTFFDAGGAWDTMDDVRWRIGTSEQDVKTNVGFGIRFTTPAFPIRLDWGYGFQHRPGEAKYQINFGIGNLF